MQDGGTALHRAARNNSGDAIELLLAANASVDIRNKVRAHFASCSARQLSVGGQRGRTALYYTAINNYEGATELLLAAKACLDIKDGVSPNGHRTLFCCGSIRVGAAW